MYTNPSNIIAALFKVLDDHSPTIDSVINKYEKGKSLTKFEGIRKSIPSSSFPSFEIEPQASSPTWAATRLQRVDYHFYCMITTSTSNENLHASYSATLATAILEIISNPNNLQIAILDEAKTWLNNEELPSIAMDSFPENISYKSAKSGTIRVVDFTWRVTVNEPYTSNYFDKSIYPNNPVVKDGPTIVMPP